MRGEVEQEVELEPGEVERLAAQQRPPRRDVQPERAVHRGPDGRRRDLEQQYLTGFRTVPDGMLDSVDYAGGDTGRPLVVRVDPDRERQLDARP
ncbi:hypothetical protein GCM10023192_41500 [Amycolatopsis samaneae]